MGISLSAFRIAGGLLLLCVTGKTREMVFDQLGAQLEATADMAVGMFSTGVRNVAAAFPLGDRRSHPAGPRGAIAGDDPAGGGQDLG